MSLFYNILDEHCGLLKSKGYDEASINSSYKDGWFMRELEIAFSLASNEGHKLNEKTDFDIKAIGFFDENKDIIVFRFYYEYDPENLSLTISKLVAEMGKEEKTYKPTSNQDLPESKDVYKELAQRERLRRANIIANHTGLAMRKRL